VYKGWIDVILEAFAEYLQAADQELSASSVLARWLWERLSMPPENTVDKVLHCEIALLSSVSKARPHLRLPCGQNGAVYAFQAKSESGHKLLKSLHQYSLSYEQQKWARWVHRVKASDFNQRYN